MHVFSDHQTFFVSLFAVVHPAEFATISWHRAQGAFIPEGATAERCIMVMYFLGKSWYRGLWDKRTTEKQKTKPDRSKRLMGTLNV